MEYGELNNKGWLAGNLILPQQDADGSPVQVGFIAKPRGG